ncbi:MAG: hypothetical protein RLY66_572 [Candidatus Parcubacteria bacterium]
MSFHSVSKSTGFVRDAVSAVLVAVLVFSSIVYAIQANAAAVTLTATVATSITFTTSSNQFGTVTPATVAWATTTLDVLTNSTNGWNITLSGDNKSAVNNNLQLSGNAASVTDQTEWIPGAATTTGGNAVVQASLASSGNVLAFRVMTASSTNGTPFISTGWWGTSDASGTAKWAGIASSTVSRQIGNATAGSYSASNHLNTVQYYLNVSASQPTGAYSAPLTYTATGN